MQIVQSLAGLYPGTKRSCAPCHVQEESLTSWKKNARLLSMEMKQKVFLAVLRMELTRRSANKIYDEMIDFAQVCI